VKRHGFIGSYNIFLRWRWFQCVLGYKNDDLIFEARKILNLLSWPPYLDSGPAVCSAVLDQQRSTHEDEWRRRGRRYYFSIFVFTTRSVFVRHLNIQFTVVNACVSNTTTSKYSVPATGRQRVGREEGGEHAWDQRKSSQVHKNLTAFSSAIFSQQKSLSLFYCCHPKPKPKSTSFGFLVRLKLLKSLETCAVMMLPSTYFLLLANDSSSPEMVTTSVRLTKNDNLMIWLSFWLCGSAQRQPLSWIWSVQQTILFGFGFDIVCSFNLCWSDSCWLSTSTHRDTVMQTTEHI